MSVRSATLYDEVEYPSALYTQTQPDRLAAVATLYGLTPPDVARGRTLELGCGDGCNLLALAAAFPEAEFVGIDLSRHAIDKGRRMAEAVKLNNVTLLCQDLLEYRPTGETFDYVLAHGLYSWVPAPVRDRLLAVCNETLSPHGIAYVSYNAYPGNHLRDLSRGMMRYHAAHFPQSDQKVRQARGLLKFLAESRDEPDAFSLLLKLELERVEKYTDSGLFHDDLSAVNQPVYFHEFAAHAGRHGLQYLAEADVVDSREPEWPARVQAVLRELDASGDRVEREQYRDFIKFRAFRQTLLCRQSLRIDLSSDPARVRGLYASGELRTAAPEPSAADAPVRFFGPKGAEIEAARPLVKAAFRRLGGAWPRHLHFDDLLAQSRFGLGRDAAGGGPEAEADAQELALTLRQAYDLGLVELHTQPHRFVTAASERPVASPFARLLLANGQKAATLRHTTLSLEDELSRLAVVLLDGTRDRAALLRDLGEAVRAGAAAVCREGRPVADIEEALAALAEGLEANLATLARLALLTA